MRPAIFTAMALLSAGCAIPRAVDRLQQDCPPPEFGRPGWVRTCAGTGAWIGGVIGGVASIALFPVTWPLSKVCGDSLGEGASEELIFMPAVGGAALGHFLFGAPPDLVDHVFRRAWFTEPLPENTYELVPMDPPQPPRADAQAGDATGSPPTAASNSIDSASADSGR